MKPTDRHPQSPHHSRGLLEPIIGFLALLVVAWCVMTITHETGHLIGGWCCGGNLIAVDLAPWRLPYSIFSPDPQPLVTLWMGPLVGVALPVGIAAIVRRESVWLIAHFCLLANGVYLALGCVVKDPWLDSTKLLQHGAMPISIALYCLISIGFGYVGFRCSCIRFWEKWGASRSGSGSKRVEKNE